MNFVKEYNLKQITPMIHFQHGEPGACIRATELKPKLDKFITQKKGGSVPNGWKLKEHDALNYKVFIYPSTPKVVKSKTIERDIEAFGQNREIQREIKKKYKNNDINGMYFGNMVSQKDQAGNMIDPEEYSEQVKRLYKETVLYEKIIILKIVCVIPELMEYIDSCIKEFFIITNFGNRQNKGFGSFIVMGTPIDAILSKGNYTYIKAALPGNAKLTEKSGLDIASVIYSIMKGGINAHDVYIKGYIQRQYLDDIGKKDIGSDKAFIKSTVYPVNSRDRDAKRPLASKPDDEPDRRRTYTGYEYVRALLGVGDVIEFKDKDKLRSGKVTIAKTGLKAGESFRYQSPVTIKVSENAVYFFFKNTYNIIKNQSFTFSNGNKSKHINTPASFDDKKFVDGFKSYFNSVKNRFDKSSKEDYKKFSKIILQ